MSIRKPRIFGTAVILAVLALVAPTSAAAATTPVSMSGQIEARGQTGAVGSRSCPPDMHVRVTVTLHSPGQVAFWNGINKLYTSTGGTSASYTYNSRSVEWAVGTTADIKTVGDACV